MNKNEYLNLYNIGFLDSYKGGIKDYTYLTHNTVPYNYSSVNELLCKDLYKNIDIKNVIILFPLSTNTGKIKQFNNGNILIDYCTYIIDVKNILHDNGIKYKNGETLINKKYSQTIFTAIIVENGIAYSCNYTANPFSNYITLNSTENIKDISINKEDLINVNRDNLEILFSGFFIENYKINY
jgi:hypothetical protein